MIDVSRTVKPYAAQWYPAISLRSSHRKYDAGRPVPDDLLSRLQATCSDFRPFPGVRAELITKSVENIFTGVLGTYGKIKGAGVAIAFIGDIQDPDCQAKVGYTGEGIILEATAAGLQTCWVGGFFHPKVVASLLGLNNHERVLSVTPVGYSAKNASLEEKLMGGMGRNRKRIPLEKLTPGIDSHQWPGWVKISLESARLAPSAMNRQPWSFLAKQDSITVGLRTSEPELTVSKRLDCGIAMLHLEVAAMNVGVSGQWEFLKPPQVARFIAGAAKS